MPNYSCSPFEGGTESFFTHAPLAPGVQESSRCGMQWRVHSRSIVGLILGSESVKHTLL